jgi:hypothetical protein
MFDGVSSYVAVPNASLLNLTTGMTVEASVNSANLITNNRWTDLIVSTKTIGTFAYGLVANDAGPDWRTSIDGYNTFGSGTGPLSAETWTHLATTYDGATQQLFVNGVQVDSEPASGSLAAGTGPLYIGGDPLYSNAGGYDVYFNGMIDEVRIYNRALSQAEIVSDMVGAGSVAISLEMCRM